MNKTREEAERILRAFEYPERAVQAILDALYGKPESERLKQLREDKEDLQKALYLTAHRHHIEQAKRMIELIDAEIAREEAKS